MAERWIIAGLRNRRFYSLAEANLAIAECVEVINARPFKKMAGSRAELFEILTVRLFGRCPRSATSSPPGRRRRSTSTTTSRSTATTTRCPTSWLGQVVLHASVGGHRRGVLQVPPGGLARAQLSSATGTPPTPRTCPRPTVATPQWTPSTHRGLGEQDRPVHRRARRAASSSAAGHPEQGYRAALGIIRLADRHGAGSLRGGLRPGPAPGRLRLPLGGVDPRPQPRRASRCPGRLVRRHRTRIIPKRPGQHYYR